MIELPCTPDLAETGVTEVVRALAHPSRQLFLGSFDEMRLRVAENIVSLALQRFLAEENIPHKMVEPLSFVEADRYDVTIGGRRCVPVPQLVCREVGDERVYLQAEDKGRVVRDVDLYLFMRLEAKVTRSREEIDQARLAGKPVYLIHQMPGAWSSPEKWVGLDPLSLKTDTLEPVSLELHGMGADRAHCAYLVELAPRRRVRVKSGLYALGSVHARSVPSGPMGIHSPVFEGAYLINPYQWGNIWVYAEKISLMGYTTKGAFDRQASMVSGEEVDGLPNPCLRKMSLLGVPASALTPVEDLFARARAWEKKGSA